MRSCIILLAIISFFNSPAQESTSHLSLSFEDSTLHEILNQIEQKSDFHFYYITDWLSDERISGEYQDISVNDLLAILFKDTLLNFYISEDNSIFLIRNNTIYNALPKGFFGNPDSTAVVSEDRDESYPAPIFYNELLESAPIKTETIRIGKEDKSRSSNTFLLSGTVTNGTDMTAAPNIILKVKGASIGAVTNDMGEYLLKLPAGENLIQISSLGFENLQKRVIIYNDGTLNFDISEAYIGLDEVVIEGNVDRNVKDNDVGTTRIDVEEIKNIPLVLGERDIFKAAATLPGITNAGEGASGYNVRGGKTDQNLILLDDGVLYNPTHFFGIFSAVNPFTTDEVTIYKGHVPAKFGGRLSSVFDIKSKDPNVDEFAGEASIGPVTSNLALEIPLKTGKSAILAGGRGTYSNWILRNLDEEELRKSRASFFDVILKYRDKLNDRSDLKTTVYFSKDAFSITSDSLYSYSNLMASLQWSKQINEKYSSKVTLTNSRYQFDIDFDGQTNTDFELGYKIHETSLKAAIGFRPTVQHSIQYGVGAKIYGVKPGSITPKGNNSIIAPFSLDKEQALEGAVYISDLFTPTEKISVEAGIRFSVFSALGASDQRVYMDGLPKSDGTIQDVKNFGSGEFIKTYGGPEFRVSGRYLLDQDFSVKGSFNSHYQYIHTLSTNTTVSPVDTWKLSDLNIKPQQAMHYSLGLYKNFDENTYALSVEGYFKKIRNLLDYKVGAQLLLNDKLEQEVLQGEGKAYGVEFLIKKLKGRFSGWLGYTYSRTLIKLNSDFAEERVNDGDYFPSNYDKPHDLSVVANFKITQRFSFSGNFVYQTGRPVTVPKGTFILDNTELVLFSDRNEFRIPDFYRLDLSFNVEGNHKLKKLAHSFWNISVYNVLGRNNPYSVFFVTEEGEIKAYQSSIFSLPIPTISYNLKF